MKTHERRRWHGLALSLVQFLVVSFLTNAEARAAGPAWRLERSSRAAVFEPPALGQRAAFCDRGVMIYPEDLQESVDPGRPNLRVRAADGSLLRKVIVWPDGATQVTVRQAAMAPGGDVIATGWAVMADRTRLDFVARTDSTGRTVHVIRTNPFSGFVVCAGDDGTVWVLGHEVDKEERHEDYPLLRQYSLSGGLIRETLPRRTFAGRIPPTAHVAPAGQGGAQATFITYAKGRVVVYANLAARYVEIDAKTGEATVFAIDRASVGGPGIGSFALTSDGSAYMSPPWSSRYPVTGLFRLDRDVPGATVRWVAVEGTVARREAASGELATSGRIAGRTEPAAGTLLELIGSDGDELLVSRATGIPGVHDLSWEKPVQSVVTTDR